VAIHPGSGGRVVRVVVDRLAESATVAPHLRGLWIRPGRVMDKIWIHWLLDTTRRRTHTGQGSGEDKHVMDGEEMDPHDHDQIHRIGRMWLMMHDEHGAIQWAVLHVRAHRALAQ